MSTFVDDGRPPTGQRDAAVAPRAAGAMPSHLGAVVRLLDRPIDPADLVAWSELAARPRETRTARHAAFVIFRLGAELLGLPVGIVRRVQPAAAVRAVPHRTNDVLRGVCNVRGQLVPAADLRRLLGLPPPAPPSAPAGATSSGAAPPERRMLVLDATGGRAGAPSEPWAVEVDGVLGVERVDPATVRPAPTTVDHALDAATEGLVDLAFGQVALLDVHRVLGGLQAALR